MDYNYALGFDKLRRMYHIKEHTQICRIACNDRKMIYSVTYQRYEAKLFSQDCLYCPQCHQKLYTEMSIRIQFHFIQMFIFALPGISKVHKIPCELDDQKFNHHVV